MKRFLSCCFVTFLVVFLSASGCAWKQEDAFDEANEVSLVVALCKPVMKDNRIIFQIVEIWRDESGGNFSKKVGDSIDDSVVYIDNVQQAVLFWGIDHGQLFNHAEIYVYDGIVYSDKRMSVETAKQLVQRSKSSPVELNIPVRSGMGDR